MKTTVGKIPEGLCNISAMSVTAALVSALTETPYLSTSGFWMIAFGKRKEIEFCCAFLSPQVCHLAWMSFAFAASSYKSQPTKTTEPSVFWACVAGGEKFSVFSAYELVHIISRLEETTELIWNVVFLLRSQSARDIMALDHVFTERYWGGTARPSSSSLCLLGEGSHRRQYSPFISQLCLSIMSVSLENLWTRMSLGCIAWVWAAFRGCDGKVHIYVGQPVFCHLSVNRIYRSQTV